MSYTSGFKECSCWCIFSIATIILLFSVSLILNDLTLIAQNEGSIEEIINTPIAQLRCLEVCQTWYTIQNSEKCCDRYNSNLCLSKKVCKEEYIIDQNIQIEILKNDAQSELAMIVLCVIVMVIISLRKLRMYKKVNDHLVETDQENLEPRILEAVNKILSLKESKEQTDPEGGPSSFSQSIQRKESGQTQTSITKQKSPNQQYCQCIIDFIENHHCDVCDIQSSRTLNQNAIKT